MFVVLRSTKVHNRWQVFYGYPQKRDDCTEKLFIFPLCLGRQSSSAQASIIQCHWAFPTHGLGTQFYLSWALAWGCSPEASHSHSCSKHQLLLALIVTACCMLLSSLPLLGGQGRCRGGSWWARVWGRWIFIGREAHKNIWFLVTKLWTLSLFTQRMLWISPVSLPG